MNLSHALEAPPPDFVTFLAQRSGLSQEAAEQRLECWLGEYHATTSRGPTASGFAQSAQQPIFAI